MTQNLPKFTRWIQEIDQLKNRIKHSGMVQDVYQRGMKYHQHHHQPNILLITCLRVGKSNFIQSVQLSLSRRKLSIREIRLLRYNNNNNNNNRMQNNYSNALEVAISSHNSFQTTTPYNHHIRIPILPGFALYFSSITSLSSARALLAITCLADE